MLGIRTVKKYAKKVQTKASQLKSSRHVKNFENYIPNEKFLTKTRTPVDKVTLDDIIKSTQDGSAIIDRMNPKNMLLTFELLEKKLSSHDCSSDHQNTIQTLLTKISDHFSKNFDYSSPDPSKSLIDQPAIVQQKFFKNLNSLQAYASSGITDTMTPQEKFEEIRYENRMNLVASLSENRYQPLKDLIRRRDDFNESFYANLRILNDHRRFDRLGLHPNFDLRSYAKKPIDLSFRGLSNKIEQSEKRLSKYQATLKKFDDYFNKESDKIDYFKTNKEVLSGKSRELKEDLTTKLQDLNQPSQNRRRTQNVAKEFIRDLKEASSYLFKPFKNLAKGSYHQANYARKKDSLWKDLQNKTGIMNDQDLAIKEEKLNSLKKRLDGLRNKVEEKECRLTMLKELQTELKSFAKNRRVEREAQLNRSKSLDFNQPSSSKMNLGRGFEI